MTRGKKYDRNVKFEWKRMGLRSSAFKNAEIEMETGNGKTYCRSLRCWRFFLNAFFTRNIKNAARSMESDVPFSAFSFLSPFSYVFFVVPSFIVWPSGPRTHAPSEFTVCSCSLCLHSIIFYWLFILHFWNFSPFSFIFTLNFPYSFIKQENMFYWTIKPKYTNTRGHRHEYGHQNKNKCIKSKAHNDQKSNQLLQYNLCRHASKGFLF